MDWNHCLSIVEKISDDPNHIEVLFNQLGLDLWAYQNIGLEGSVETNYPELWVERYVSQNYFAIDPVVLYSLSCKRPFLWDKSEHSFNVTSVCNLLNNTKTSKLSEEQMRYFEEAEAYNLNYGFLIPISNALDNASYAFAPQLITKEKLKAWCKEHIEYLQFICNVNYRLNKPRAKSRISITPKEREVLHWLSEGKSSWEISRILNISERTVNFHTANIKTKLQATNRSQIVSAAFREKLLF